MNKVSVYKEHENGKLGVGIRAVDAEATLADLLLAWQPLCDDQSIYKAYAVGNYSACKGCQVNCCKQAYVIPDLVSFKMMSAHLGIPPREFAGAYLDQEKLRLNLPRLRTSPCIFLQKGICTVYPVRTLICRFYLCTYILGETEELIYSITLAGMAATQAYLAELGLVSLGSEMRGVTSYERSVLQYLDQYRESQKMEVFLNARDYTDIPLGLFNPPQ